MKIDFRKKKLFTSLQICSIFIINNGLVFLTNCSSFGNRPIQLANFESYMSQDLINDLKSKYDIQFQYYTTNEVIESKFTKYYDIAVPSCYQMLILYQKGLLEKIDWSQFGIEGINTSKDAKTLFNSDIIDKVNEWVQDWTKNPENNFPAQMDNILDYCVPYFAQSLMFAYKNEKQKFYHASSNTPISDSEITWDDIFYTISSSNPEQPQTFRPQNNGKVAMLDDCRSIYDVARIVETNNETNVPQKGITINDVNKTYNYLTKYFANKGNESWMQIQTDSGIIATNLANHKHGYIGAITWSGDILYAAMGAGEHDAWDANNFHIVKPLGGATLNEVDTLVINKNHQGSKKQIYDIIKQIALDGCNVKQEELFTMSPNDESKFKYWTIQNFDAIGYTPMLKNIYEAIVNEEELCAYWDGYEAETIKMYQKIIRIEQGTNLLFGKPLTSLQNSNMHWAWLESKEKF